MGFPDKERPFPVEGFSPFKNIALSFQFPHRAAEKDGGRKKDDEKG